MAYQFSDYQFRKILAPIAGWLRFINPDWLSYISLSVSIGAAACLFQAGKNPNLLCWAFLLVLIRLALNTLAVAIGEDKSIRLSSEIIKEVPDNYGEVLMLLGIGLSQYCHPVSAMFAIASLFLTRISGVLGIAVGVDWQRSGWAGKTGTSLLLMVSILLQYFSASFDNFGIKANPLELGMILLAVLGQITVVHRLSDTFKQIKRLEWFREEQYKNISQKLLVVYDSQTGNTEKVAEEISHCLNSGVRKVDEVDSLAGYDLVIFGTPNINSEPSSKISELLKQNPDISNYAFFVTYGDPLVGKFSTGKCLSYIKKLIGKEPLGVFSCKAYNPLRRTFLGHPDQQELLNAFIFATKLAKLIAKK